jgi:5-methylcytosine-specific restriction enzyme A
MPVSPSLHCQPGQVPYAKREVQRKSAIDMDRGSAAERGYGYRWQKYRKAYLAEHPLCCECWCKGVAKASVIVDHIRDHRGNVMLFWAPDNHQALCVEHHSAKTARTVLNAGV